MQGLPFPIITYQVITGNYSSNNSTKHATGIITYQVITGNYSDRMTYRNKEGIITYQVITGNYSGFLLCVELVLL